MTFLKEKIEPSLAVAELSKLSNASRVVEAIASGRLSWALSEKLMLAVTSQLDCRYCRWVHTDLALKAGISESKITSLLAGKFKDFDISEQIALKVAIEYGATNKVSQKSMQELSKVFEQDEIKDMLAAMEFVYVTNLLGNTFDSFIHRVKTGNFTDLTSMFEGSIFLLTLPMYTGISIATSKGKNPFADYQA